MIDGLERNWREEKLLIDEKSKNNRRTERNGRVEEQKQLTDWSGTGDYKSRNNCVDWVRWNWPEEKRLIDEKSRNNWWTGAERPSKKQKYKYSRQTVHYGNFILAPTVYKYIWSQTPITLPLLYCVCGVRRVCIYKKFLEYIYDESDSRACHCNLWKVYHVFKR